MKNRTRHEKQKITAKDRFSTIQLLFILLVVTFLVTETQFCSANWIPLADTGQTICYDIGGTEITCPEKKLPLSGQDAQYNGAKPAYQDNSNETVTDKQSGLVWIKSSENIQHTWQNAISYCNELDFAGHTDWRLPDKFELESIVDYGKSYPAINEVFDCERSFYWSTTPHANNPAYAWSVFCYDGADHWVHKTNTYFVRCVRTGQ
jgi:hypothetical protein